MTDKIEKRTFRVSDFRASGGNKIEGKIPYESESVDMGGWTEVLEPGCFSESLRSSNRIMSFWNHDTKMPLGSTEAGTLKVEDRQDSLSFTILTPNTNWGRDAHESVRRGDTVDVSFGFNVPKDGDEWKGDVRHIIEADLLEISPVSWGAYPETQIQARQYRRNKIMDLNEIYTERNKTIKIQRDILDKAHSEGRSITAEEKAKYEKADVDFTNLTDSIKRAKNPNSANNDLLKHLEEKEEMLSQPMNKAIKPDPGYDTGEDYRNYEQRRIVEPSMRNFSKALRVGWMGLNREEQIDFEKRALQVDKDVAGGYLVTPEQFVKNVIAKLKDMVLLRQYATVIPCEKADSLGIPALDHEPDDGEWTAEILTGGEDDSLDFDKRKFFPHPMAKRIKISKKLIRTSVIDVVGFVRDRLAYRFAVPEEKCFIGSDDAHGTGSNQPLGLMTASALGISTNRDVSAGNTATAMKVDGLINAFFNLKAQYRRNARWIFHRDGLKQIRKLKTGEGDYIWKSGLADGRPDTILGKPVDESEYMRNTFEANQYLGIVGDMAFYYIADALAMEIQVLTELYAETNQNGYIARKETDGMPVLEEAFVRVKLGA